MLVYFRNRHQDVPGYDITRRRGWKVDLNFRYGMFSFTVIRKIMLEFSFFISVRYKISFEVEYNTVTIRLTCVITE